MTDYTPLSDGNAFPADPAAIADYGRGVQKTGELIAESVRLLRRCADANNWQTDAADAFREKAEDLAKDIDKSRGRYEHVGATLVQVSGTLDRAQVQGAAYAAQARQEEGAAGGAEETPGTDPTGASVPLTPEQTAANTKRQAAIDEIARLQRLFDGEVHAASSAADDAARAVRGALHDGVKDSWWDRNAGWLKVVTQVLSVIIAIAAIVLLTVATAGTIWIVVSVVAGVTSLAINTALALTGNGSWWAVSFDAVAVASFGAGALATRALAKSLPLLRSGLANLKGAEAFEKTFGGLRLLAAKVVSRVPLVGRYVGGRMMGRLADDAFEAMDAARRATTTVPTVSRAAAALRGGREAATDLAELRQIKAELEALKKLPAHLVPEHLRLLKTTSEAVLRAQSRQVAFGIGTVGGLVQGYQGLADGVDLDDLKDGGNYARVVIDILSRVL